MKSIAIPAMTCLALAACAKSAENVEPQYVSVSSYRSMECAALEAELQDIQSRVTVVSGEQDDAAARDGVAVAVGLIIFWPALFVLAADDSADELGRLKGEYEAVLEAGEEQACDFAKDIRAAEAEAASTPSGTTAAGTDGARPVRLATLPEDEPVWGPEGREVNTARSAANATPRARDGDPVDPGSVSAVGAGSGIPDDAALPDKPSGELTWEERRQIAAANRANRWGATQATE